MQEHMSKIIAMKNKSTQAINGELSSDGLSAMLGDDGDLRSLLLKSVKEGKTLKGSTEDWISQTTDRARELLAGIGKKKVTAPKTILEQFTHWSKQAQVGEELSEYTTPLIETIEKGEVNGFDVASGILSIDYEAAFGFSEMYVNSQMLVEYLLKHVTVNSEKSTIAGEVIEPTTSEAAGLEPTVEGNLIMLVEVKASKSSKRRKTVTSEAQLVFDLFA